MMDREKIEILQKKTEIPETVREKMQLAYEQIRQEKRIHEGMEAQKEDSRRTGISRKKIAIILAAVTLSLATVSVTAGVYIRWSEGLKEKLQLTKNTGRRAGGNGSGRVHRSILHQSGNHGYCVAEYYRSEFQPSGVFGKRILGRNERTARL